MTPISWGVLGTARIGLERVLPAMRQSELCDVRAIASRDARRAAPSRWPIETGLANLRVLDAIRRSGETGHWEPVSDAGAL